MEVVSHGKTYKTITCNKCKCVFSYVKKDIKNNDITNIWRIMAHMEEEEQRSYVICPECGNEETLYLDKEGNE